MCLAALSRDNTRLAVDIDGQISVWDVQSGGELRRFAGHTDDVRYVAFSPDGKKLFTAGFDPFVIEYEWPTGKPIRKTLKEHPQAAPDAAQAAASAAPKARLSPHVRREAAIRRALKLNDPLVTLARLACDADPVVRLQAAKALAPYLYPAQRAVEVSGAGGEALTVEVRKVG